MRRSRRPIPWLLLAALLALAASAEDATPSRDRDTPAEPPKSEVQQPGEPQAGSGSQAPVLTVYIPPSRGAARVRAGGGTRGVGEQSALRIEALAPDHVALTLRGQPTLAWYASGVGDARVDFTLIAEDAIDPLAELTLAGPFEPGVHLVDLAELGLELEPETVYQWSVTVVVDPQQRDRDIVSSGAIRWTSLPQLAVGPDDGTVDELARGGVWYDAIAKLSEAIADSPRDGSLRARRAALLQQVGLDEAASYDREPARGEDDGRPTS